MVPRKFLKWKKVFGKIESERMPTRKIWDHAIDVMNIEWDYSYYQPWSDNEWLVDEMLAMLDEDVTMQ